MTKTKKIKKYKSQPRINGITRIPKVGSFHPIVESAISNIAKSEGKSYSYIIAEIISDFFGVDCRTGEVLDNRKLNKGR